MTARKSSAFTKRTLDGVTAEAKKRRRTIERGDSHDHAGLRFRATHTGKGTWFYRYRDPAGVLKLTKIGDWPDMPLKSARDARDKLAKARRKAGGALPAQAGETTVRGAVDTYISHISRPGPTYLRSHGQARSILEREAVSAWGDRDLDSITKDDVRALVRSVRERDAPVMAVQVFANIRRLYNWAIDSGDYGLEYSPCDRLKMPDSSKPRERWLKPAELRRFLRHAPSVFEPSVGDALLVALRTGQRIGEVAGLPWSEIDLDSRTWYLPGARAKNGQAHEVPLPEQVVAILSQHRECGEWVFAGRLDGHIRVGSVSEMLRRKRNEFGFDDDVSPHILRHSVLTHLAKMGCPRDVRERIANHRTIRGMADRYDHHARDAEARDWLQRWNDELDRIAGVNIIELTA